MLKPRNPVSVVLRGRKSGPMKDRRKKRAKAKEQRELKEMLDRRE